MSVVNILVTSPLADEVRRFGHGDHTLVFTRIDCSGDAGLIDGAVWAFVDWLLPDCSGLELVRRLRSRAATAHAHITVVLEDDDPENQRRALRAGADDYMQGPLTRTRLLDRIMAMQIGDLQGMPQRVLSHGHLSVDLAAQQVRHRGKPIALMPNEFRLLRYLVEHPGRVFARAELIAALGKEEAPLDERTVDVWVGRLRRALRAAGAGNPLRTVRNMGYVFDSE